mmetsp:Transcript_23757/g.64654  ORF Transcript_23757/g.64654 Transcript_23757/m.64654 type:complete len:399 (+) Transcript_23757:659-1855(+)
MPRLDREVCQVKQVLPPVLEPRQRLGVHTLDASCVEPCHGPHQELCLRARRSPHCPGGLFLPGMLHKVEDRPIAELPSRRSAADSRQASAPRIGAAGGGQTRPTSQCHGAELQRRARSRLQAPVGELRAPDTQECARRPPGRQRSGEVQQVALMPSIAHLLQPLHAHSRRQPRQDFGRQLPGRLLDSLVHATLPRQRLPQAEGLEQLCRLGALAIAAAAAATGPAAAASAGSAAGAVVLQGLLRRRLDRRPRAWLVLPDLRCAGPQLQARARAQRSLGGGLELVGGALQATVPQSTEVGDDLARGALVPVDRVAAQMGRLVLVDDGGHQALAPGTGQEATAVHRRTRLAQLLIPRAARGRESGQEGHWEVAASRRLDSCSGRVCVNSPGIGWCPGPTC